MLKYAPEATLYQHHRRSRVRWVIAEIFLTHHEKCECACPSQPPRWDTQTDTCTWNCWTSSSLIYFCNRLHIITPNADTHAAKKKASIWLDKQQLTSHIMTNLFSQVNQLPSSVHWSTHVCVCYLPFPKSTPFRPYCIITFAPQHVKMAPDLQRISLSIQSSFFPPKM